jgi:hypothetical protein
MVFSANYQRLYDFERKFDYNRKLRDALTGKKEVDFEQNFRNRFQ